MERHFGDRVDSPESVDANTAALALIRHRELVLTRSAQALEALLAQVDADIEASPQVARAVQASENRWRSIENEFGLWDSGEVSEFLGGSPSNRNLAHSLSRAGRILAVRRGRKVLYPGFQFDQASGGIHSVITAVSRYGKGAGWESANVAQWFCAPNGHLGGLRPVDILDDGARVMRAARADLAPQW